jgi:hypothetical protein
MGWSDHRIFGQGVAGHPIPAVWGWSKPPQAFGDGPATPKCQKKKKKKNGFGILGVAGPPLRAWGWLRRPVGGGRSHPQALRGGPTTPKIPNQFFRFFFSWWPFGWPDHPQRPEVASSPPYGQYGVAEATPWPKIGWSGHPIFWARGGSSHPDFPLFFSFFLISLFFSQKKTKTKT